MITCTVTSIHAHRQITSINMVAVHNLNSVSYEEPIAEQGQAIENMFTLLPACTPQRLDLTICLKFDRSCCNLLQVLELTEMTLLRNAIVGEAGVSGLGVEQRKRLTIGVELVRCTWRQQL